MADPDLPELDALDGVPHPREAHQVIGHDKAEEALLEALASDRLHHAWMLSGPQGIGKASFAWRAARYLLTTSPNTEDSLFGAPPPPVSLDTDPEAPEVRRILIGTDQRLFLLRRGYDEKTKRPRKDITVEDARKLKSFFGMSIPDGGRRVVIVDAADDMNRAAANALLKALEEPPENTVFFLITHQPARLLPTIRSRCRVLRFTPLSAPDLIAALGQIDGIDLPADQQKALFQLSDGSVRTALMLNNNGGTALYAQIVDLLDTLPRLDRSKAMALSALPTGTAGADRLNMLVTLAERALGQVARQAALGRALPESVPGEAALRARLAPSQQSAQHWADAATSLPEQVRKGAALNLDPSVLLLDMFQQLQATARQAAP